MQLSRQSEISKSALDLLLSGIGAFCIAFMIYKLASLCHGVLVIWPIDGLAVALMLGPFKARPLLLLLVVETAALVAGMAAGYPSKVLIVITSMQAGAAYTIFYLMRMLVNSSTFLSSKYLFQFLSLSALISLMLAAFEAPYFSYGVPFSHHVQLYTMFAISFAASWVGYAVVTPLLLIFINARALSNKHLRIKARTIAILAAFGILLLGVFAQTRYELTYLIPIALMAVAYTVELPAVALAVLMTVTVSTVSLLIERGQLHFVHFLISERIIALQIFLIIITASALPIATLMAEHERLKRSLIASRVEAETANKSKSVFLATMSHEIRTPLNGVLGMAQVLAMNELSASQRERVAVITRSGEGLLSLLNDVLDLSKLEAGKMDVEIIDFDLGELMDEAVRHYSSSAQEKGITLVSDLMAVNGVFKGDSNRIRQILYNLISNALKFTNQGEVSIISRFDAKQLSISVSDSGMGIPADKIDRLFSKFTQVDESTTRRFGGTGLGLSICRELAELMGGKIEVQSLEGIGSTFTLSLPLEQVGDALDDAAEGPQNVAGALKETIRVLAAEDNATNQLVLKALLSEVGVEVAVVENGAEAVESWERESWDLILMDVQMPVMDGPSATKAIRAREATTGRVRTPIIALTANTMVHQVEQYLSAGMDAHLAKPINAGALFQILAQTLEAAETPEDRKDSIVMAQSA